MQNTLNTRILLKHDTPENWVALAETDNFVFDCGTAADFI